MAKWHRTLQALSSHPEFLRRGIGLEDVISAHGNPWGIHRCHNSKQLVASSCPDQSTSGNVFFFGQASQRIGRLNHTLATSAITRVLPSTSQSGNFPQIIQLRSCLIISIVLVFWSCKTPGFWSFQQPPNKPPATNYQQLSVMAFGRQAAEFPDGSNQIVSSTSLVFVHHELKPMP